MVSVNVKHHVYILTYLLLVYTFSFIQLLSSDTDTFFVHVKHHESGSLFVSELRSCVKVEVAVLGSPSLIVLTVSVDVKQH